MRSTESVPSLSFAFAPRALLFALLLPGPLTAGADVVISEIFYHPPSECEEEEFIEIHNPGDVPVDISGWRFVDGILFEFPPDEILGPGEYAVVARDPAGFQAAFGSAARLFGPYDDKLGNSGELVILAEAGGTEIDQVRYNDKLPWPALADGGGPSLELLDPLVPNEKARNWRAAGSAGDRWILFRATGEIEGETLSIRLTAPGEYLVDDISLVLEAGGEELIPGGGFDDGLAGWLATGDYAASEVLDGAGRRGGRCLRVRAIGGTGGGIERVVAGIQAGTRYVLSAWARRATPGIGLIAGFAGGSPSLDQGQDIGDVGAAGSHAYDGGTDRWTVQGSGADIWGSADAFHFVYTTLEGDGAIETEAAWSGTPPDGWSKAGVMIRESTAADARQAMVILSRDNGVHFQWRTSTGGGSSDAAGPASAGPVRVRLERDGEEFLAFADTGGGWSRFATTTIAMGDSVRIGVAVTAHQRGSIARATFDGTRIEGGGLAIRTPLEEEAPEIVATPGAPNTQAADGVPPYVRDAEVLPVEPTSLDPALVEVEAEDADGMREVTLEYQTVPPGRYIRKIDPEYAEGWRSVAMQDDGVPPDREARDGVWTAEIPAQPHRTLVRYRFIAEDVLGAVTRYPYPGEPTANLAYFVYDGIPDYVADRSSAQGPVPFVHPAGDLAYLPLYHLIARAEDIDECENREIPFANKIERHEFKWWGTFVHAGRVYDHVRFRLRGGVWRYTYIKRYYKIRFNPGEPFRGIDNFGRPYPEDRKTLNLNSIIGNPSVDQSIQGECGLYESLTFLLFRWAGVPSAETTWVHFRIVDDEAEAPDQYGGDFYGIYLDLEQPDQAFLEGHDRPADGNLYKIDTGAVSGGRWDKEVNSCDPADDADIRTFVGTYEGTQPSEAWWDGNLDLAGYYSYRAIVDACEHYDIGAGKNYYYYHNPASGLWEVFPWDTDLTFVGGWGDGNEPFKSRVLDRFPSSFGRDYSNRVREIDDLLYREDRIFPLIDAWTAFISPMTRADRDRWDQGLFRSTEQRASEMKAWIRGRLDFMDSLAADSAIPETPEILSPIDRTEVPAGPLLVASSPFADPNAGARHTASAWIATRIPRFTTPAGTQEVVDLVPAGARWRFLRGTADPAGGALAWTEADYDDAAWEEGPSGFGYGDGDDATVLDDMRYSYTGVYLRRIFEVEDPSAFGALELSVDVDDGYAAYLNGIRVATVRVPAADPIPFDDIATGNHEAGAAEVLDISDRLDLLREGANAIAIHALNVTKDSSDFSIIPALRALVGEPPEAPPLAEILSWNELAPDWSSGETQEALASIEIPGDALEPGGIYRL
ncbi:MAG: CotH kinase family protein, partial [Planctomycetes bacterium]|nr:CotH kinase family protein [Planctomycetota bacterium]